MLTCTATYTMTQQKDGLEAGDSASINIGGVTLTSAQFTTGTATITVKSDGSAPTISIAK
ncbi:MAG: hypothetical protein IJ225_05635 [Solobacterium sp.]|nr:hypothetical protein [Solobacterium sp.]